MSESTSAPVSASIELNAHRVVTLQGKKGVYTLTCRRVTPEDWEAYFSAITVGAKQEGRDRVSTIDVQTPRLVLADRVIVKVEGYTVAGGADLMSFPDWQQLLPLSHRLRVSEILSDARPSASTADEDIIYPEGEPVSLDCSWSDDDGGMVQISGLIHVLKTPKEIQHRRYMREASRTRVMGGSRTGETLYPGAQTVLAELYDELVVSVEGYTIDGKLLVGRENIAREMDMHHKVMAAQEIFQPRAVSVATKGEVDESLVPPV